MSMGPQRSYGSMGWRENRENGLYTDTFPPSLHQTDRRVFNPSFHQEKKRNPPLPNRSLGDHGHGWQGIHHKSNLDLRLRIG